MVKINKFLLLQNETYEIFFNKDLKWWYRII